MLLCMMGLSLALIFSFIYIKNWEDKRGQEDKELTLRNLEVHNRNAKIITTQIAALEWVCQFGLLSSGAQDKWNGEN